MFLHSNLKLPDTPLLWIPLHEGGEAWAYKSGWHEVGALNRYSYPWPPVRPPIRHPCANWVLLTYLLWMLITAERAEAISLLHTMLQYRSAFLRHLNRERGAAISTGPTNIPPHAILTKTSQLTCRYRYVHVIGWICVVLIAWVMQPGRE